jgi:short subunit dehydrogenase-like uncharacterized protein
MSGRNFDVVLFGATGFTGKLVAEYLSKNGPKDLRWCIAGRNRDKLEAVRRELDLGDLPIRVADGHDEKALEALVPETRVVCTTVGPYAKHGVLLARIAAKSGTHYCDLTGEPQFIRRSIDENEEPARKSGARIVHTCGFDSIPFDLGVLLLWDHAKKTGAKGLRWAKGFCGATKGSFSGGTIASMAVLFDEATKDKDVRRLLGDPHALDPVRTGGRTQDPFEQDQRSIRFDPDIERWTAPFLMATVNTRVVRRSNALTPGHYGEDFKYQESMSFMKGPKGFFMASGITAALGGFAAAFAFAPTRKLITNKLKPGDGPSKEEREAGYFKTSFVGETEDGQKIRSRVEADGDPGYQETAKMLGESAMCLARDGERLPKEPGAGVLTPSTAMGMALVERLRAAGMRLSVDD